MSFGSSTRFQAGTENGKPVIFWQQQGLAKDKKKKFSYKEKSNKHPLRQSKQKSTEESSPTHKPPAAGGASRAAGAGNRQAAAKPAGQKGTTASKASDGAAKANRAAAAKKGAPASDPNAVNPGTVTLTQDQLNNILETIGRLTISNQELSELPNEEKAAVVDVVTKPPPAPDSKKSRTKAPTGEESIYSMAGRAGEKAQDSSETPEPSALPLSPEPERAVHTPAALPASIEAQADTNKPKPPREAPKAPLSKAELKRLQWEKERAEAENAYNPWGRPGAGAPIRDQTGNIMADYKVRKNDENDTGGSKQEDTKILRSSIQAPPTVRDSTYIVGSAKPEQLIRQSQEHVQLEQSLPASGFRSETALPPTRTGTFADRASVEPAAIRSSFTLGAVAPDGDRFTDHKSQQKRQWLEDLERQREEQRLRKEAERRKLRGEDVHDTWADRMGGYKPQALPQQDRTPTSTVDDTAALQMNRTTESTRTNSAPTEKSAPPSDPLTESQSGSYLRGQNVLMDPQTQKELEEKRKRQLEHQEYIKKQVEEKDKQKRLERERKIQEEMEEERKLQAQRDQQQRRFEQDQEKQKAKEENTRKRLEDMKKAMDAAKEQADREKHQKRLRKLEEGGHQTSRLHENFEAQRTPRRPNNVVQGDRLRSGSVVQMEPTFVPGLNLGTARDDESQVNLAVPDQYTANRLLTPSQYRGIDAPPADPSSPRREFGTQTDPNVAKQIKKALGQEESSDTTDAEYNRSRSRTGKKVRLKSAPKEDKPSHAREAKNRPRWGQGAAGQKPKLVKNSDKDPSYQKNKRQKEARRKERQKKLLAEADKYARYVPGDPTAASRARSRSPPLSRMRSRSRSPPLGESRQTTDSRSSQRPQSMRSAVPSPPVPALRKAHDPAPEMESDLGSATQERVPHSSRMEAHDTSRNRPSSPLIPALKHKPQVENDYNVDAYNYDNYNANGSRQSRTQSRTQPEAVNGQFVPFVRSTNVLDPAHAESPIPMSRENTAVEKARRAYIQNTHPANYGVQLENLNDKNMQQEQMPGAGRRSSQSKNPIMNPDMVKKIPTERQGQILQQLTELRKGLQMKQRELEIMAPLQTVEVE